MVLRKLKRFLAQDQNSRNPCRIFEAKTSGSVKKAGRYKTVEPSSQLVGVQSNLSNHQVIDQLNACCRELIQLTVQTEELNQRISTPSFSKFSDTNLPVIQNITDQIKRGLSEAECLVAVNDYIKSLESELQRNRKLIKTFSSKNKTLQICVLQKHQEWLSRIHECELLQRHVEAWRFALSLHDPNYSCVQQLITNPYDAQIDCTGSESDVPTNLSNLPWIWLAEDKCEFQAKVNDLITEGQLPRAVQVTIEAFDLQNLYPASQRHRWIPYYVVELTKAIDYLSDLSIRCYREKYTKPALICANHAVRLLMCINLTRSIRSVRNLDEELNVSVMIRTRLTSALIHETEWAVLLEATRKLIQVFWLASRFNEVGALLLAVVRARRDRIGPEARSESWKGFTQLACLLTGGLCLFTGQISQISLITYRREDQLGLCFAELAVCWLEASLAVCLTRCADRPGSESDRATEQPHIVQSPSFNLWAMMMENLARHCANIGAVYDVVLLAVRVLSILCRTEPWRTSSVQYLSQLLPVVLTAEGESQNRTAEQTESHQWDSYLKNIQCTELNEALETFMKELVLVCRGQQWNTAATLLEWWVTGCQLRRQNLEVRHRRVKSHHATGRLHSPSNTNHRKVTHGDLATPPNTASTSLTSTRTKHHRTIRVRFIDFLIKVQMSNSLHIPSSERGQPLSQISLGKHRDFSPDEILCNFSGSSCDPRSVCFLPTLKQLMPMCMATLEKLTTLAGGTLSESLFLLSTNRKLFTWCKQYFIGEKHTEVSLRLTSNPFLDISGLTNLWDDAIRLAESELSSALSIKQPAPTGKVRNLTPSVTRLTKMNAPRLIVQPFPVTHNLAFLIRADRLQRENCSRSPEGTTQNELIDKQDKPLNRTLEHNSSNKDQWTSECTVSSALNIADDQKKYPVDCWNSLRRKSRGSNDCD